MLHKTAASHPIKGIKERWSYASSKDSSKRPLLSIIITSHSCLFLYSVPFQEAKIPLNPHSFLPKPLRFPFVRMSQNLPLPLFFLFIQRVPHKTCRKLTRKLHPMLWSEKSFLPVSLSSPDTLHPKWIKALPFSASAAAFSHIVHRASPSASQ